jgi:hypothetical protein
LADPPNRRETVPDQDWKHGGVNRKKYVIRKTCVECDGDGEQRCRCGARGIDDCTCSFFRSCLTCDGKGSIPVDPAAAYFVLRIDGGHDPHAPRALACYADSVEADNPELAEDIRKWLAEVGQEHPEPKTP